MIQTQKSGIFLRFRTDTVFELRFEIKSPKLPLTPNYSLIHPKKRNHEDFLLPELSPHHQNDDYDVIFSN